MNAITPAAKDPVFELIERCCEAWKTCDEAWEKGRAEPAIMM
jgi:hypothetical protein